MVNSYLNRFELSQYTLLSAQVAELDTSIKEAEDELAEVNKSMMCISPILTGMPSGNEKRDKIGDFVVRLERDRNRLNDILAGLVEERYVIMYRLQRMKAAVNTITDEKLREIIIQHYFEGSPVSEIAKNNHMTPDNIYKKIYKVVGVIPNKKS